MRFRMKDLCSLGAGVTQARCWRHPGLLGAMTLKRLTQTGLPAIVFHGPGLSIVSTTLVTFDSCAVLEMRLHRTYQQLSLPACGRPVSGRGRWSAPVTAPPVSAVPREFLCEHASSKSRVLVLLAHPDGPACVQAVFTCRDARAAQQAARLLSSAALNGTLTEQQETTAHKIATQLPDAPAASFRQALERARAGVWPSTAPASFSWPADDPLEEPAQDEPDLPVSAARSPKDARLADLPGPVVRVVQLREAHVYDQAKVLAAAAACGWVPVPEEELGEDDPYDVVGAVMFAAETQESCRVWTG
jgi:hypothetical protein